NAWKRAYDPTRFEFNGLNMYQWLLSNQNPTATSVLPVTLTSFDASAKGSVVELNWNTASESNSAYFAVERSSNGQEWKEIGRVKASGNSATAKNYRFTDNAPLSGNNYYRLKMVDLDASFKLSEMKKVSMNGSDLEFSFGPNPVINEANIRISGGQRTRLNVTVTDLMGRTMKSMSFTKTDNILIQKINLAELPAGQYILSIKGDNVNYTQRIMKR
ncbi:MAG TPA: T9SS type A sorting domain-containing protein, partial [Chitinophagaceae bacterium]|nr:T9SS type A sorting domain-containing protein [Chitinophagaceae bacterium]